MPATAPSTSTAIRSSPHCHSGSTIRTSQTSDFVARLGHAAVHKPANPDIYSVEYADFVDTFARVLGDPALPHLFFVEGGALAVENALKVAFDWKSRRNERAGRPEPGDMVMHLRHAFHGRSGYTLSLTNTDPLKTDRFPKFDWPRISSPALRFPLEKNAAENRRSEDARDRRGRRELPREPASDRLLRRRADPGRRWRQPSFRTVPRCDAGALQDRTMPSSSSTRCRPASGRPEPAGRTRGSALEPDVVAFAKKVQLGGVMAGRRVDDEPENVFRVPAGSARPGAAASPTWSDRRRILEVIERDGLVENAGKVGDDARSTSSPGSARSSRGSSRMHVGAGSSVRSTFLRREDRDTRRAGDARGRKGRRAFVRRELGPFPAVTRIARL